MSEKGLTSYSCEVQPKLAEDGSTRQSGVLAVHDEIVRLLRQMIVDDRSAGPGPTFAQHSLLAYIASHSGCRATQVSEVFGVHRSTVSRQLRVCIDEGWVHAESGPLRSGHPLTLTEVGTAVLASTNSGRVQQVTNRLASWSREQIETFALDLRRFREAGNTELARRPEGSSAQATNGDDLRA